MADSTRTSPLDFLVDVREQWRKITWPDQAQLKNFTAVTLGFLGLCALVIFGMDMIVKLAVDLLHSLFGASTPTTPVG
jgi:preprotein translocase SecE subunit